MLTITQYVHEYENSLNMWMRYTDFINDTRQNMCCMSGKPILLKSLLFRNIDQLNG